MEEFLDFFKNKKNLVNVLFLGILVLAIPIGVSILRQQQILKSRAVSDPIVFTGPNVEQRNGAWVALKPQISVQLTSPLGPPGTKTAQNSGWLVDTVYAGHDDGCGADSSCPTGTYCDGDTVFRDNEDGSHSGVEFCPNGCEGGACKDAPPGGATCSNGTKNVGDSWPECKGCAEGIVTCTGQDTYGWNVVKDPSPNCPGCGVATPTPAPTSPSTGKIACKSTFKPVSELGISDPSVCDRLHQYVADCSGRCDTKADCPQNTRQPNFINPSTSNWCYEFKDTDGNPNNNNKCLQLEYIGKTDGTEIACEPGETGVGVGCSGNACTDCVIKNRQDILPFYKSNGWDISCGNQNNIINNWCGIDPNGCNKVKSTTCASQCGVLVSPTPSARPSGSPSGSPSPAPTVTTVSFRIAESRTDLDSAPWQNYTSIGMTVNYEFKDKTPGQKFVFVQFKDSNGKTTTTADCPKCQAQIRLLGGEPVILGCSLGFEGNSTVFNIAGKNFGTTAGTVTSGTGNLSIREWKDNIVRAIFNNPPTGQTFPIVVTNSDGQKIEGNCSAISQLALGAKVFCRAPSSHNTDNVDLTLAGVFQGGTLIRQKVTIDKEGLVQGLNQKLEEGKEYKLSLKAPRSLRKTTDKFAASGGTTNIPNFVLPVGDIFPADGGDGMINSLDKAELNRQWIISLDAGNRSGDFNKDNRVNSIDWACMRFDFGDQDDPEPVPGQTASGSATIRP